MSKSRSPRKSVETLFANHSEDIVRLKRIRGQIEGVERMILESRYCLDIVTQMRSITAALKSVETLVMERHIRHCVSDAISAPEPRKTEEKINELVTLFKKR